jgi:serine/threonine protein kinase
LLTEKEIEELQKMFELDPNSIIGEKIGGYNIKLYIGHGKVGIVYKGENDYNFVAAIKIIPNKTLKDGWEEELKKLVKLEGINGIAHYKGHGSTLVKGIKNHEPCIYIIYDFINGTSLNNYLKKNASSITLEFVIQLLLQVLTVFYACKATNISHEDLHEGNIMISNVDERLLLINPQFIITDFGLGGSTNKLDPKKD